MLFVVGSRAVPDTLGTGARRGADATAKSGAEYKVGAAAAEALGMAESMVGGDACMKAGLSLGGKLHSLLGTQRCRKRGAPAERY